MLGPHPSASHERQWFRWIAFTACSALTIYAYGDVDPGQRLADVPRGGVVTIKMTAAVDDPNPRITATDEAGKLRLLSDATTIDKGISVKLPVDLDSGRYVLDVITKEQPTPQRVPGELRILPDAEAIPVITNIEPGTVYSGEKGRFEFWIFGDHFGKNSQLIGVEIEGAPAIPACTAAGSTVADAPACFALQSDGRAIQVKNWQAKDYQGPLRVRVRAGKLWSEPKEATLSRFGITTVRGLAIVLSLAIVGIVLWVVRGGIKLSTGKGLLYGFLIDPQTNSYSLSKAQLLAWTAAGLFAYIYFFLARLFIQWKWEFPDIPDGFPALLAISAGTAVIATGVTQARGTKGAGPTEPTMADFISSGGVVQAERLQHLIWTLVGVLGFLALMLAANPAALTTIPPIPTNFLALMGVSSLGYLAGKAIRTPGPVIRKVGAMATPAGAPTTLNLTVTGENLASDATIMIDDAPVTPLNLAPKKQAGAADDRFCTSLQFDVSDPSPFFKGNHTVKITNWDGQFAAVQFTAAPPTITTVPDLPTTDKEVRVTVTGEQFVDGMTATWLAPNATTPVELTVQVSSPTTAVVRLTPGMTPGPGHLALTTPTNNRADVDIAVTTPQAPTITGVSPVGNGQSESNVQVTGTNFTAGMSAQWSAQGAAQATEISGDKVVVTSPSGLSIMLVPGAQGTGTLTLRSQDGKSAATPVTVT